MIWYPHWAFHDNHVRYVDLKQYTVVLLQDKSQVNVHVPVTTKKLTLMELCLDGNQIVAKYHENVSWLCIAETDSSRSHDLLLEQRSFGRAALDTL